VLLENFQKPPGGLIIAARRHMQLVYFLGSSKGTAWRHIPSRQVKHGVLPNSRFLDEGPSGIG